MPPGLGAASATLRELFSGSSAAFLQGSVMRAELRPVYGFDSRLDSIVAAATRIHCLID